MMEFGTLVERELKRARIIHSIPLHSHHEAESVIREEFEEYVQLVRAKDYGRNRLKMLKELVHVGAMAQRAAEDLGLLAETPCPRSIVELRPLRECISDPSDPGVPVDLGMASGG